MRYFTLTASQFDDFFYPAFRASGVENEDDLEVTVRVIKKLKTAASPEVLDKARVAEIIRAGGKPVPDLKLDFPDFKFALEEDEWKLCLKKWRAGMSMFTSAAAEEVYEVLQILKDPLNYNQA